MVSNAQKRAIKKFNSLHPEYMDQQNKKWRLNHPSYMKKQYQKQIEKDPIAHRVRRLLHTTKKAAKQKKFEHSIDKQWCLNKLNGTCEATGLQFDLSVRGIHKKMNPFAPSIDRIDNDLGYTKDNCQMVVWIYNCSKNTFNSKDLYKMCKAFVKKYETGIVM
jgi:hypothetical protein